MSEYPAALPMRAGAIYCHAAADDDVDRFHEVYADSLGILGGIRLIGSLHCGQFEVFRVQAKERLEAGDLRYCHVEQLAVAELPGSDWQLGIVGVGLDRSGLLPDVEFGKSLGGALRAEGAGNLAE